MPWHIKWKHKGTDLIVHQVSKRRELAKAIWDFQRKAAHKGDSPVSIQILPTMQAAADKVFALGLENLPEYQWATEYRKGALSHGHPSPVRMGPDRQNRAS